nr:acyltransferase [Kistimonas asteriae]
MLNKKCVGFGLLKIFDCNFNLFSGKELSKSKDRFKMLLIFRIYQKIRIAFYRYVSDFHVEAIVKQPLQVVGKGKVIVDGKVIFGYKNSKDFFSRYHYIEVREESASIIFGDNTIINNSFTAVADKSSITIGKDCLIGTDVQLYDSDFHGLSPDTRRSTSGESKPIVIGDNVFIGNNVTVLKGSRIGKNSVIAAGSLVCGEIPANCIAAGVPCKKINDL